METPAPVHFPKIEPCSIDRLTKLLIEHARDTIIVREKIDGSNFTVFNDGKQLRFYNKNSEITGDRLTAAVWDYTVKGCNFAQYNNSSPPVSTFRTGYTYHCEALRRTRSSHIRYTRIPRYHLICYEIILPNGFNATPEQMHEILAGTGVEIVPVLWSNSCMNSTAIIGDSFLREQSLQEKSLQESTDGKTAESTYNNSPTDIDTLDKISAGCSTPHRRILEYALHMNKLIDIAQNIDTLPSCLGNFAEGFVITVLNRERRPGVFTTLRAKFVSSHMKERKEVPDVKVSIDSFENNQAVIAIGDMFNVEPRFVKALNRLEERGEYVPSSGKETSSSETTLNETSGKNEKETTREYPNLVETLNRELDADLEAECKGEIMEMLYARAWPVVRKAARADLYQYLLNKGLVSDTKK